MRKYFALLALIGFLLYFPSLFGPFLWDDEDFVYANKYVENFQVDKFFTDSQTAGRGKLSNYFRPIPQIAYASVHTLFGFNPFWYHLLNVSVHILAACAIFYFFYLLFNEAGGTEAGPLSAKQATSAEPRSRSRTGSFAASTLGIAEVTGPATTPFLISVLFLIHPVQTEAVSYISGLSDPLFVFFGFLSLIFFLLKDERKNMIPLSLFFFILSLLSKETGIVFLPLLVLTYLFRFVWKSGTLDFWNSGHLSSIRKTWTSLMPFALCSMLYLWYHLKFINSFDIKSAWGNNPYANSLVVRILTFIQNLYAYVALLIFPKDLFMERDYTIHIQTNFLNPYLSGFIIAISLICLLLLNLRRRLMTNDRLLWFCFLAFFISFIPYTGIVLINGIFYEHFLYLPLVFFFAFIITLITPWFKNKTLVIILISYFLFLISRNLLRQFDWTDSIRFYSQTLSHAPKSIRIINGLGMAYADKGELDNAIRTYSQGIGLNSHVPNLYHNLANAYAAKGDTNNAEKNYLKALEADPKFYFSYQSLANLYQQTGQKDKLEKLIIQYSQIQK